MINLLISDLFSDQLTGSILENAALVALEHQNAAPGADLSLVIEDDDHLHALNKEFLDIDAPTDVLSFPTGEETIDPETGREYLGDVIISFPRALEQANAAGHNAIDELQLLVVHGVLHLLGHDHAEPEEKEKMWTAQRQILEELNVHLKRFPE